MQPLKYNSNYKKDNSNYGLDVGNSVNQFTDQQTPVPVMMTIFSDIFEDYVSPVTAALNLLEEVVTKRKNMLNPLLVWAAQILGLFIFC